MKFPIRLMSITLLAVLLAGCTSMTMKSRLKKQLEMGGRYRVEVLSFDPDRRKAWVKLWDKTYTDARETPKCPYKYENGKWVEDSNAFYDMRPPLNDAERTRIRNGGTE